MLVKVHNNNVHDYTEDFRGKKIVIPAGAFVEMDEDEADYFMQTFTFPVKDSQGRPDPKFFKKLKIERPKVDRDEDDLICHANGTRAATEADLAKLLGKFSHMLAEPKNDERRDRKVSDLRKENKDLKGRLERIEAQLGMHSEALDAEGVPGV